MGLQPVLPIPLLIIMYLNKVITVIAGCAEDSDFNCACYIAENLSELLPNFSVQKIKKLSSDWKAWLEDKCESNEWSHASSPLIWRETGVCGGSCTYVGGLEEFKNFIKHYYGISTVFSTLDQKALDLDYSLAENLGMRCELDSAKNSVLNITISGAGRSACPDLVAQLALMKEISENGISIKLHDRPGHYFKIKDIVRDATAIGGELCSMKSIERISEGLDGCNILIILDLAHREDGESVEYWLRKNYESTKLIAEQIMIAAPADMKVIFCSTGPSCFCANVMIKEAPKLDKQNVVAVSGNCGLEMIYEFAKSLNVDTKEIGCPPVWGFLGVSHYVDVHHTLQRCNVYVPNKRALTSYNDTNLPLGIQYKENRWFTYLAFDKKPHQALARRKSMCLYQVGRTEDFQKCKAICDLLKLWYQKDDSLIGDEIITLGVASNGTFDIPNDLFFSQPVHLKLQADNSRVWVPYSNFPLPHEMKGILRSFVNTAISLLQMMNVVD